MHAAFTVSHTAIWHQGKHHSAGGFIEVPEPGMEPADSQRALADDLRFVHKHLASGGQLRRLDHILVVYSHHGGQLSHATPRALLFKIRARAFEARVLSQRAWASFSVWGAGRDAKAFVRALSRAARAHIAAFAEIHPRKIGTYLDLDCRSVPVVHFEEVQPPVVVCVAKGRTGGELERNVASRGLVEGDTCWYFV
jgi:hypothetical protein